MFQRFLNKARITYAICCLLTLFMGVLSRQITTIPFFFGDTLYAVLLYFGFRFLVPNNSYSKAFLWPLLWCYGVEFFQLYQASWIISIRKTILGHYILGQGFLWSDLGCYLLGISMAFLIDYQLIKAKTQNS